ncbi:MAG: MATE family efflux transporter [Chloroflexi bacterium]|nr:MATE family efflux transporter [Chloroflexota bacterium]
MAIRIPSSSTSTFRAVVGLAAPVVATEIGLVTMGLVDTLVVGRLGAEAIGAVGLGNVLVFTVAIFGMGLLLGLDTVVSQSFGAGRLNECHRWLQHGVLLGLLGALPLTLLARGSTGLLSMWGIDPGVMALVVPYMEISAWSVLPLLVFAAFRRYLQAMGVVLPIAGMIAVGNLVNLVAAVGLVFGHFGMPALGTDGSALATLISRTALAAALVLFAIRHAGQRNTGLLETPLVLEVRRLRRLVSLGLPAALQFTMEVGVFATATALAGSLTATSLASHQIVLNVATVTFIVPFGVGAAAAVLVGQSLGAEDPSEARRRGWIALALGVGFMACSALAFVLIPEVLLAAFTSDPAVIATGVKLLLVAAAFQVFDGLQAVATGALRGLGDTRTPMVANLVGYWVLGLPLGYVLCFTIGLGVVGVWMGLSAGLIVIGLSLLATWVHRMRALVF